MGFMQKLRQNMPAVVIFLILMFVVLIVFEWGDARRGRGSIHTGGQLVGTINGEEINSIEYESRVDDAIQAQRQANPEAAVDDDRIREGMWNQIIEERLIEQTATKLGISISDDQLREGLLYDPPEFLKSPFTDSTGFFNQQAYFEFMRDVDRFLSARKYPPQEIAKIKKQLVQAQEEIRRMKLREAVQSVVGASYVPSPTLIRAAYDLNKTKATGVFAYLDANLIPDTQVNVTEEEAHKYYDAHRDDFQQKTSRELRYALFSLLPSAQDSSSVTRRLKTVMEGLSKATTPGEKDTAFANFTQQYSAGKYNGTSYTPLQEIDPTLQSSVAAATPGTIIGPVHTTEGTTLVEVVDVKDSGDAYVKAQHILIRLEKGKGNEDSVKAFAEKIAERARSGENFATLAGQFSGDPGSAQRGGDLGYFKKGMMVKPFEEAVFNNPVGSIVGPIKTDFGYHIIKVNDRSTKSYKLRDLKFDVHVGNTTKNLLKFRAKQFHDKIAGGESLDSAAAKEKIQVLESGAITRTQPVSGSMKLTYFAYGGKVGDVSDVVELKDGSFVVAMISKVLNPGPMDFADTKDVIMDRLRRQKKLDLLKARAEKLQASLAAGDTLNKLSSVDPGVQIRNFTDIMASSPFPGVGNDYALTSTVFSAKPGTNSGLVRGDRGYYIVHVNGRTEPTDQQFAAEQKQFTQQYLSQKRSTLFQEWLQKQREQAEIADLRSGKS